MADNTQDPTPANASLDDVLADYIAAEESGEPCDRRALLAAHPHVADELREFFTNRDQMQRLAQPLRGDPAEAPLGRLPLGKLRYFGDYELLEEVAVGGMGIVYRARQVSLNRIVAVKMILKGTLATAEDVRRFRAEAEAAANLQHPGIVAIHEVGLHEGQHYFSMDFVEGQNLANVVREQPLPIRQAVEYLREAAEAVHYAHQQGTLHRDLKPSNILIDRHERVRITDFGLAKRIEGQSDLTLTGQVLGTPAYMPPEQAMSKRSLIGAASDVYSLGAVLYELLAGRPPFRGETPVETLRQVESLDAVSPRLLNPAAPRDLETICLKCLEKEPHKRYGTAQLLADDLGRFLRGEPIHARPISHTARAWRWCRRNPVGTSLGSAVALLALTVAVVSTAATVRLKRERDTVSQQKSAIQQQSQLTQRESERARDRLWVSLLETARARRMSRSPGQHFAGLRAVQEALNLPVPGGRALDELRNEAIGCLLLPDLEAGAKWDRWPQGACGFAMDDALLRYAYGDNDGHVSIRRLSDNVELMRLADVGRVEGYGGMLFSPDGRFLFHGGELNGKLWRVDGYEPVLLLDAPAAYATFRRDSQEVAISYRDGTIRIHDPANGQEMRTFPSGEPGARIWWNPQQPILAAVGAAGLIRLLDTNDGRLLRVLDDVGATCIDWHPAGRLLALTGGSDLAIEIWDTQTGKLVQPPLTGHRQAGIVLCFNHAGDRLLSNDWNGIWRLWDVRTGQQLLVQPAVGPYLKFSRDDRWAAANMPGAPWDCNLFCFRSGSEAYSVGYQGQQPQAIGFLNRGRPQLDATGRLLAIACKDGVALVDIARGEIAGHLPLRAGNFPLRFEPRNAALLTSGRGGLLRWPIHAEGELDRHLRFGPPQKLMAATTNDWLGSSADGQVVAIPNYSHGAVVLHRDEPRTTTLQPQIDVRFCAVSPDGRWVATGSHGVWEGSGAKIWEARTSRLVRELPVGGLNPVDFSPDGKWLATTSGGLRLWSVGDWKPGPRLSELAVHCAFASDGPLLAVEDVPGVVRLLIAETGREVARISSNEPTRLQPLCFSRDGGLLVTYGRETEMLHMFNLRAIRRQLAELGLDWDQPPLPPAAAADDGKEWTIDVLGESPPSADGQPTPGSLSP